MMNNFWHLLSTTLALAGDRCGRIGFLSFRWCQPQTNANDENTSSNDRIHQKTEGLNLRWGTWGVKNRPWFKLLLAHYRCKQLVIQSGRIFHWLASAGDVAKKCALTALQSSLMRRKNGTPWDGARRRIRKKLNDRATSTKNRNIQKGWIFNHPMWELTKLENLSGKHVGRLWEDSFEVPS